MHRPARRTVPKQPGELPSASGFIPKTLGAEALRAAIAAVLRGDVWAPPDVDLSRGADAEIAALIARLSSLTPQQVRVLMMLSGGLPNKNGIAR